MVRAMNDLDQSFLRQAIDLAMRGRGGVEPNPMVGCVIAREARIIGQGYHQRFGQPHAEPHALAACSEDPRGATAYVTLEPCCHTDKKTPPCVPRLIEAGVARVVVGCLDPNPKVNGLGVRQLRDAGVLVEGPLLEAACKQLIAPFILGTQHRRPYVTLKWARSADGLVAGSGGMPVRISNERSTRAVHELRARCDAIVVGINTVLHDDPMLTARGVPGARPLTRVVLDSQLRLPPESRLAQSAREAPVIVCCCEDEGGPRRELETLGVRVEILPRDAGGRVNIAAAMSRLYELIHPTHVLVEAGPTLARAFFEAKVADRVWVIQSPRRLGVPDAPRAAEVDWPATATASLDDDLLTEHLNPAGPAFFANEPSADLALAASLAQ